MAETAVLEPVASTAPATNNTTKTPTVTLCMIVKDEAHVIERCLSSVLPVIDHWVIVDTGSTDGTQKKIKDFFDRNGVEGTLHESKWVDFGTNRPFEIVAQKPIHIHY